jgi:hypothetical protein
MSAVFSGNTPGPGGLCSDFNINATELNLALKNAEILNNGVLRLTKIDNSIINNNIPFFPDFVISGIKLSISTTLGVEYVLYTAGNYQIDATVYSTGSGSIPLTVGHPTLPRVDILYADEFGTINYLTGTPAVNPIQPTVPLACLLIAAIGVAINASTAADYTLVTVNYNNIANIPIPNVIDPGTAYGNTLYWNGSKWIETDLFNRVTSAFSVDSYEYLSTDLTGIQVVAKFGESPNLGERGSELTTEKSGEFHAKFIIATEAVPTPTFSQIILDVQDLLTSDSNITNYSPLSYSTVLTDLIGNASAFFADSNSTTISSSLGTIYGRINTSSSGTIEIRSLDSSNSNETRCQFTTGSTNIANSNLTLSSALKASFTFGSEINYIDTVATNNSVYLTLLNGKINLNGGIIKKTRNTAIATSILADDWMIVSTAALTVTLPAAPVNGHELVFRSTSGTMTINGNGKNIEAAPTQTVLVNTSRTLVFNTALNRWLNI